MRYLLLTLVVFVFSNNSFSQTKAVKNVDVCVVKANDIFCTNKQDTIVNPIETIHNVGGYYGTMVSFAKHLLNKGYELKGYDTESQLYVRSRN